MMMPERTVTAVETSPSAGGADVGAGVPRDFRYRGPTSSAGTGQGTQNPAWDAASEASASGATSLSQADDLSYAFKRMEPHGLSDPSKWARKAKSAGYRDMDDFEHQEDLEALARELEMPSGIARTFIRGIRSFKARTFDEDFPDIGMGNIDATAPRQANAGINWASVATSAAIIVGGTVVTVAVGGAAIGAAGMLLRAAVAAPAVLAAIPAALADCLDGDAEITLFNRTRRKMVDLQVGDQVLCRNLGHSKVRRVLEVVKGSSRNVCEMELKDSKGETIKLRATTGHPFFSTSGWAVMDPKSANFENSEGVRKLVVGDTLVLRQGKCAVVQRISEPLPKTATYNVILDGPGAFFVHDILSHSGLPPRK